MISVTIQAIIQKSAIRCADFRWRSSSSVSSTKDVERASNFFTSFSSRRSSPPSGPAYFPMHTVGPSVVQSPAWTPIKTVLTGKGSPGLCSPHLHPSFTRLSWSVEKSPEHFSQIRHAFEVYPTKLGFMSCQIHQDRKSVQNYCNTSPKRFYRLKLSNGIP